MEPYQYQFVDRLDASEAAALFEDSGIRRPTKDLPRLQRMLDNATLTIAARRQPDGQLVGLCRALTDFSYCCYLSDLAVARSLQGQGIGASMVSLLRQRIGEQCALILLASPEAMAYYPKIGFQAIQNGFMVPRAPF